MNVINEADDSNENEGFVPPPKPGEMQDSSNNLANPMIPTNGSVHSGVIPINHNSSAIFHGRGSPSRSGDHLMVRTSPGGSGFGPFSRLKRDRKSTNKSSISVSFAKFSITSFASTNSAGGDSGMDDDAKLANEIATANFIRGRQDSIFARVRPGDFFTEHADVLVENPEKFSHKLANLGELRHFLRTETKNHVKKFIRKNEWPPGHRVRADLWRELCLLGSSPDGQKKLYDATCSDLNLHDEVVHLPHFATHPGVVISNHRLREASVQSVHRLLCVIEHVRPDFTYIPTLYTVVALFLHYIPDEDEVFACVMALLAHGQKFFLQTDIAATASKRTMLMLTKKHLRNTYQLLRRLISNSSDAVAGPSDQDKLLVPVFDCWKSWMFKKLPFSHLVRLMDSFLYEGQKVQYRVALAILHEWHKVNQKKLSKLRGLSTDEISSMIQEFCSVIPIPPEKLMRIAFGLRNLSTSSIQQFQQEYELRLRREDSSIHVSLSMVAPHGHPTSPGHFSDIRMDTGILDKLQFRKLYSYLPPTYQILKCNKVFSFDDHGTSFKTLWRQLDPFDQTIVLIRTTRDEIFGAFCKGCWATRNQKETGSGFFGFGESFIFRFSGPRLDAYPWVGLEKSDVIHSEELFMAAGSTSLIIGGGSGEAISFRDTLESGSSYHSDTFDNPPLADGHHFTVGSLEVFGLGEMLYEE